MAISNILEVLGVKDVKELTQTAINGQVALEKIQNNILINN